LLWLGQRQQCFQRRLIAPVAARLFAVRIHFHLGLRAGPMQVQVRIEVLFVEPRLQIVLVELAAGRQRRPQRAKVLRADHAP